MYTYYYCCGILLLLLITIITRTRAVRFEKTNIKKQTLISRYPAGRRGTERVQISATRAELIILFLITEQSRIDDDQESGIQRVCHTMPPQNISTRIEPILYYDIIELYTYFLGGREGILCTFSY